MSQYVERIPYYPNRKEYEALARRHSQENEPAEGTLPQGFPRQLISEMVWEGQDISLDHHGNGRTKCMLVLDESQLKEIDAALRHFHALNKPLEALGPPTFPLPTLHPILRSTSDNLHSGYGFTVIRGIPVERYTREENMIIYVGLTSHIGCVRGRQDDQYEGKPADVMIAHITDFRASVVDEKSLALAAYTDGEVIFHNDVGDIVSLFALDKPASGGESLLASGWKVYNELARTRPDLIKILADDWSIPSAKQDGGFQRRPLLFYQPPSGSDPERVIIQFSRRSFSGFGAQSHSKLLTRGQAEAIDAIHFLAEKFHVAMELEKGDIQLINNMSILHARRSYLDDSEHKRHLLRLWLRDPQNSWVTPEPLRARWARIYDHVSSRGPQVFPLDPIARSVGKVKQG